MDCDFYKSLDREFELFGIKGRWVRIFLIGAGASIATGLVVGFLTSAGIGIVVVIVFAVLDFLGCMLLQGRLPSRQVEKAKLSGRTQCWVLRRETLSRILLPDENYVKVKNLIRNAGAERPATK